MAAEPGKFSVLYLASEDGRSPIEEWFVAVKDRRTRQRIDARLARVRAGNLGDHRDLGGGIYELRLFFGAGYRIYFAWELPTTIILLCAGDKASQTRDVEKARRAYADYLKEANGPN